VSLKIIVRNDSTRKISYDGTRLAAQRISGKIGGVGYENGVMGGNALLDDITTIQGLDVVNVDGDIVAPLVSSGGPHDPRYNTILRLENDAHAPGPIPRPPMMQTGLPEVNPLAADRTYLQQILEVFKDKLCGTSSSAPVPPNDLDLQTFLLGVILMSKCR